jgi:hypothetical protein
MFALLAALPSLLGGVTSFMTAWQDAKVRMLMIRAGVTRDVAVQMITSSVAERTNRDNVIAGSKLLQVVIVLMALPIVGYEWKVVVYDNILGWGSTPAIRGEVAAWLNLIVNWLFGSTVGLAAGGVAVKIVKDIMK